jgi:alkylation response protein AidB-like acyl-CoA dehydrogenase
MSYTAPVKDMLFAMQVAGLDTLATYPGFEDAGADTAAAVLEECAKFNEGVIAPLNWTGDQQPSWLKDGAVTTTPGFKEAFRQYAEGGWQGIQHDPHYGGQGLPKLIGTACLEMLNSANLSFALCPLLSDGAIEALETAGSDAQKALYLPRLVSGEWTGTMNLTEPQAGSDLALVRSKAVPQPDGSYRISGTKIFITYGEHDMAANIVHLVLARTPGAPEGVKGISLFIVPKFLVAADGTLGARNDVWCTSIEHKLGIKASPTAVLVYGDGKGEVGLGVDADGKPCAGAVGYLVGQENRGLEYMFIMMNAARFAVGMQGVGIAERAYQKAAQYARERIQSRDLAGSSGPVAIVHHPDVKRMLMTMRALTEGARALAYIAAAAYDTARRAPDADERRASQAFYEFMVPIVKGFSTEMSLEVASHGVQIHGGMGFIEETGAAQYYRDARILTIYEGTTAIQANDLIGRKTLRDGGALARSVCARVRATEDELAQVEDGAQAAAAQALRKNLHRSRAAFEQAIDFMVEGGKSDIKAAFAGSVPYLMAAGTLLAGWALAREWLACARGAAPDGDYAAAKMATAQFYAAALLPRVRALVDAIVDAGGVTNALAAEAF